MPNSPQFHPKHEDWLTNANFDNCLLNRKDFGEFLSNYLVGEKNGFVLNLNGAWGSGKTEFCKRLYSNLIQQNHPCIYIDAWESDFSKEPLTVITSELLNQMEKMHSDVQGLSETRKTKRVLGKMFRGLAVGLAGGVTNRLFGDPSVGIAAAQQWVDGEPTPEDYLDKLTTDYAEQVDAIKLIRESLSDLATSLKDELRANIPVVVIVDELDRCRPDYAIELLEVIKHFFNTDNFVFIVSSDTEQLCESIKNVYGNMFDSRQYLKRFFDRTATLPVPNIANYVEAQNVDFSGYSAIELYPQIQSARPVESILSAISVGYDLKIRDVNQLIDKLSSCLRSIDSIGQRKNEKQFINIPVLISGLIDYERKSVQYETRTNTKFTALEMSNPDCIVFDDLNVSTLLDMSLFSITQKYRDAEPPYTRVGYFEVPLGTEFDPSMWGKSNENFAAMNIIRQFTNINMRKDNRGEKIWLWEDYKKVIELAGHLD